MKSKKTGGLLTAITIMSVLLTLGLPAAGAAPMIVHHPPMSVSAGMPITINVSVVDTVHIEKVTLNYRYVGETENRSLNMEKVSGNSTSATYEVTIDGKETRAGYMFYTFNITDADGSTISPTYTASIGEAEESGGQLGIFIMAMVVAVIFIILEIGLKYRHI